MKIRAQLRKLGYKIRYVSDKIIGEHVACYYIEYKEKKIRSRVAMKLKIPLNEIWVSEKYRCNDEKILKHEFKEIDYRWKGYGGKSAHIRAKKNDSCDRLLKFKKCHGK